MKIEKINENQIRCTLTGDDLARRKIRLSELTYGSDKAKLLFRDMMQQAHNNFGFDSESSPLMIEAIPLAPDSIVLIITKVDDPEELDTRFSRFSPGDPEPQSARVFSGADEVLSLLQKVYEKQKDSSQAAGEDPDLIQAFHFARMDELISAARTVSGLYNGRNSLLLREDGSYDLIIHRSNTSAEDFNKLCNILSEYGTNRAFSAPAEAYLCEHGDILIKGDALQKLAQL